jgi:hypothetical protein
MLLALNYHALPLKKELKLDWFVPGGHGRLG